MNNKAREKAIELYNRFRNENPVMASNIRAKRQVLICVDEILNLEFDIRCDASERCVNPVIEFWQQVKTEINKI